MSLSVSPGQVVRKPCFIELRRIDLIGMKSVACRYCASSGLVVWSRMLFTIIYECCVSRVTSHITVCLLLVPFIIVVRFLKLTFIACLL